MYPGNPLPDHRFLVHSPINLEGWKQEKMKQYHNLDPPSSLLSSPLDWAKDYDWMDVWLRYLGANNLWVKLLIFPDQFVFGKVAD